MCCQRHSDSCCCFGLRPFAVSLKTNRLSLPADRKFAELFILTQRKTSFVISFLEFWRGKPLDSAQAPCSGLGVALTRVHGFTAARIGSPGRLALLLTLPPFHQSDQLKALLLEWEPAEALQCFKASVLSCRACMISGHPRLFIRFIRVARSGLWAACICQVQENDAPALDKCFGTEH